MNLTKAQQAEAIAEVEKREVVVLRSGLGLPAGNYKLVTPNNESIFRIKEVTSKKDGKTYALTMVQGMVIGKEESNSHISAVFGLDEKDRQLVVTLDQWLAIEPNQSYDLIIGINGRVQSLMLINSENVVETSKVITTKNKAVTV